MKLGESHNGGAVQQSSISCVLRRIGQICTCKRFLIPENICIRIVSVKGYFIL